MFAPTADDVVRLPADGGPYLLVVVDTEEEFDWATFSPAATAVTAMRHQGRAQRLFEPWGLVPTYVVDYPVAAQPAGYGPLGELLRDGRCRVGAHLHPWVNPPLEETVGVRNSFAGNLPRELERRKLRALTRTIEDNLGVRPTAYKAGRYGAGPNTAGLLDELGYTIDLSVLPGTDLRRGHGPDYRRCPPAPYRFHGGRLLEIPMTVGLLGLLAGVGPWLYGPIAAPAGAALRLPAVAARAGLLNRVTLTPEGVPLAEAKRLTRALLRRGQRTFVLSYHSPSLEPGHTPYVRTRRDLDAFLAWLEGYLAFFFEDLGGRPATPELIRDRTLALAHVTS